MNDRNKKINIQLEVEKGRASLRQAEILSTNREYDGAVSRAYYAVFHFARAVLLSMGLDPASHEGVSRLFNLHFVRTGVFQKKYSTILSHARKAREESDYSPEIPFSEEEAVLRIAETREFIQKAESHLSSYME